MDGRTANAIYTTTTTNIPIEAEERHVPFVVEEYAILPDTGGAGRRRGGNRLRRVYRFNYDGVLSAIAGRGRFPIWGLFGGEPGSGQSAALESNGEVVDIGLLTEGLAVRPGNRLIYTNGGGGGYGPPSGREPEKVLEDVLDGWVTPEMALAKYRVSLKARPDTSRTTSYEIDWEDTRRLRASKEAVKARPSLAT